MMTLAQKIRAQAEAAQKAAAQLARLGTAEKNRALAAMAQTLRLHADEILAANALDVARAAAAGLKSSFLDRLQLTPARLSEMAAALEKVAALPDPVGRILSGATLVNGLTLTKLRVPLGVIGIVYEARPNVTADAAGLCLKAGNAVLLKGGSEALATNRILAQLLAEAALEAGLPREAIQLLDTTKREAVTALIRLNGLVDVVIPRGSAGLIKAVLTQATVPVIETGAGVCHTYIDADADLEMAIAISFNAKVQRPSTCNAMETLLVHALIAPRFLPPMLERYLAAGVEIRGDAAVQKYSPQVVAAQEEDWATEYNDLRLAVKVVPDLEAALEHIARYGTKHSEAIVTNDYEAARAFQLRVDAACVYVNASTRFTDGNEFGFGAEIGISTQKLHARGPMALEELTTTKYLINGSGQVRA